MTMPCLPTKRTFPFLLLLSSLSILLIFSLYSSRLNPDPDHTPSLFPDPRNFTLVIKVLAYNRLPSLSRCLRSLAAAHYLSDSVPLHIYLDHFPLPSDSPDRDLAASREILDFVDSFQWRFGEKVVHYRTGNVGLQAQWLEAWWPSDDRDEFAFVVEDDVEVSALYYRFVKEVIRRYYYDERNRSPWIYGVTLQRPRFVAGRWYFLLITLICSKDMMQLLLQYHSAYSVDFHDILELFFHGCIIPTQFEYDIHTV